MEENKELTEEVKDAYAVSEDLPEAVADDCVDKLSPKADSAELKVDSQAGGEGAEEQKPEKKKSKKGLIILAVVAIILILAFIFRYSIMNLFMSPEQRMAFALLNTTKEQVDKYENLYEDYISALKDSENMNVTYQLDFTMGEGASQLLSQTDVDASSYSWINSASYQGTLVSDESGQEATGDLSINEEPIASIAAIVDKTNGKLYAQIPTISEKYLGYDITTESSDYVSLYEKYLEYAVMAGDNALSPDEIVALVEKYLDLYMVGWSDVEEGKSDLTAGGVTATYTTIDAGLTDAEICKGKISVLTEAISDDDLKKFIESMMAFAYSLQGYSIDDLAYFDDTYDTILEAWQEDLDATQEELDAYMETPANIKTAFHVIVYVTGKNEIRGVNIEDCSNNAAYYLYAPENGKNVGFTMGSLVDTVTTEITGSGSRSGGKLSGSYTLSEDELLLADITLTDLDENALEKGNLVGKLTLIPHNSSEDNALGDTTYDIAFDLSEAETTIDIGLSQSNLELCQIALDAKRNQYNTMTLPDQGDVIAITSDDSDAFVNYCKTTDFTDFVNALQAAGLSTDMVSAIDTVTGYIEEGDLTSLLLGLFFMQSQ